MLIFLYSKVVQLYIYLFSYSFPFSRLEYWSGLLFPSPGDLPYTGIKPRSPALQADSLPSEPLVTHTYWETLTVESWERRQELETAKVHRQRRRKACDGEDIRRVESSVVWLWGGMQGRWEKCQEKVESSAEAEPRRNLHPLEIMAASANLLFYLWQKID